MRVSSLWEKERIPTDLTAVVVHDWAKVMTEQPLVVSAFCAHCSGTTCGNSNDFRGGQVGSWSGCAAPKSDDTLNTEEFVPLCTKNTSRRSSYDRHPTLYFLDPSIHCPLPALPLSHSPERGSHWRRITRRVITRASTATAMVRIRSCARAVMWAPQRG